MVVIVTTVVTVVVALNIGFGRSSTLCTIWYQKFPRDTLGSLELIKLTCDVSLLNAFAVPLAVLARNGAITRNIARHILWFIWHIYGHCSSCISPMDVGKRLDYLCYT